MVAHGRREILGPARAARDDIAALAGFLVVTDALPGFRSLWSASPGATQDEADDDIECFSS
jgi:hypothetical protein